MDLLWIIQKQKELFHFKQNNKKNIQSKKKTTQKKKKNQKKKTKKQK